MPKISLSDQYIRAPLGFKVYTLPEYIYSKLDPDSKRILTSIEQEGDSIQRLNAQKNSIVIFKHIMFPLSKLKKRLRFKESRIEKALHILEELNVFEKNKAQCFVLQSIHEGSVNHV